MVESNSIHLNTACRLVLHIDISVDDFALVKPTLDKAVFFFHTSSCEIRGSGFGFGSERIPRCVAKDHRHWAWKMSLGVGDYVEMIIL